MNNNAGTPEAITPKKYQLVKTKRVKKNEKRQMNPIYSAK
jgi:hypothetical protein